ncbi:unnamed protein product [Penicillium salamii]|uniref:Transcription factor Pcc1 n=1 Tax=Penicillium salamii TaxID=1612424 RepID=A0A9W4JX18_9EURO|nr:unnamed protein product [Penicillium salamii]CAG7961620.1 unnamed protein product [Penicillium salamii]CAG8057772.1 unnamed protein product [Penicillium salamii]CAG8068790.1 unnamed protein product [Penicillium salamii]CAG8153137.1 unnamed protein product [Penicillium salamii]
MQPWKAETFGTSLFLSQQDFSPRGRENRRFPPPRLLTNHVLSAPCSEHVYSGSNIAPWVPQTAPMPSFPTHCMDPHRVSNRPQRTTHTNYGNLSTISLPLPTNRLASSAMRALDVDAELSPFVRRTFSLETPITEAPSEPLEKKQKQDPEESKTVLKTTYSATTNRMLRVSVNGFMESLGVVLGVMSELDVDVLRAEMEG